MPLEHLFSVRHVSGRIWVFEAWRRGTQPAYEGISESRLLFDLLSRGLHSEVVAFNCHSPAFPYRAALHYNSRISSNTSNSRHRLSQITDGDGFDESAGKLAPKGHNAAEALMLIIPSL